MLRAFSAEPKKEHKKFKKSSQNKVLETFDNTNDNAFLKHTETIAEYDKFGDFHIDW